jgi:signal transduction histidine kinase
MAMPVEKLYIPFYYVPGQYYWLLTAYFMFIATYIVVDLGRMFLKGDWTERNRIKYILGGIIWGYLVGISALLLLYGFPIDPLYSMLFGLYSIPFAYAFLQYEIMDIHVAAKRAVMYASSIATISILLVLINSANEFIVQAVPGFPRYFIPFLIACASVGIATFVWQKIREVDALKYEFITIVTHKFRTPLTYMKWSLDNYASSETEENRGHAVQAMQAGVTRLVELTDLLVSLEKTEGSEYRYSFTDEDITALMRQTIELDTERTATKHITVNTSAPETPVVVSIDKRRLEFALQIILENAISYSPDNSKIDVRIETKNDNAILSITDQGIGISKDELSHMFTKFFRGSRARHVDTEGMGIGLFIAQNIIKHQKGRITVSSDGIGKGTTFTITIPLKN